jgi:hypothetical protein
MKRGREYLLEIGQKAFALDALIIASADRLSHRPCPAYVIGSMMAASSFVGVFTRVEIGHIVMGSAG